MDRVALLQQQLGQKCAVLTGYAGDQRDLGTTVHSVAFRHIRGFLVRRSAAAPSLPSPATGEGKGGAGLSTEARIPSNRGSARGRRVSCEIRHLRALDRAWPTTPP